MEGLEGISAVIGRVIDRLADRLDETARLAARRTIIEAPVLADGRIDNGSRDKRSIITATTDGCAVVTGIGEVTPVTPALRAEEPPLPDVWAGQKKGPDGNFFRSERASNTRPNVDEQQFDAMSLGRKAKNQTPRCPRPPGFACSYSAIGCVLQIGTAQQDREITPRMVMQGSIVIATQEVMQVDVEPTIARDHPPPFQVGIVRAANYEVGFAHQICAPEKNHGAGECAVVEFRGGTDSPCEPGLSADGRRANPKAIMAPANDGTPAAGKNAAVTTKRLATSDNADRSTVCAQKDAPDTRVCK